MIHLMEVEWHIHPIYKKYAANRNGQVKNIESNRIITGSPHDHEHGYLRTKFNNISSVYIHVIVYECCNQTIVNHKTHDIDHVDRNKQNNKLDNLQLLTKSEHAKKTTHTNPNRGKKASQTLQSSIETSVEESWISHIDFPGIECSNLGNIRQNKKRVTKGHQRLRGDFSISYKGKSYQVHTLICLFFHGQRPNDTYTVDHINRDPSDNRPENLRWASPTEQCLNRSTVRPIESYNPVTFETIKTFQSHEECAKYYNLTKGNIPSILHLTKVDGGMRSQLGNVSIRWADLTLQEKIERERKIFEHDYNILINDNNTRTYPKHIAYSKRFGFSLKLVFRGKKFYERNSTLEPLVEKKKEILNQIKVEFEANIEKFRNSRN